MNKKLRIFRKIGRNLYWGDEEAAGWLNYIEVSPADVPQDVLKILRYGYVMIGDERYGIVGVELEDKIMPVCVSKKDYGYYYWPTEPEILYRNDNLWEGWM